MKTIHMTTQCMYILQWIVMMHVHVLHYGFAELILPIPSIILERTEWLTCGNVSNPYFEKNKNARIECAMVFAPRCYDGLCYQDLPSAQISLYIKRIRSEEIAKTYEQQIDVWLLRNRYGHLSTLTEAANNIEAEMIMLHNDLEGIADIYTIDQRGTGRSSPMDCIASRNDIRFSPKQCVKEIQTMFGGPIHFAEFSLTSAAIDLALYITQYQSNHQVFVYGVNKNTLLVERLMHLNVSTISGYIFDGVATVSGSRNQTYTYETKEDEMFDEVFRTFLSACMNDSSCSSKFPHKSLSNVIEEISLVLDTTSVESKSDSSQCINFLRNYLTNLFPDEILSHTYRRWLARLFEDEGTRSTIPAIFFLINRCGDSDITALNHFMQMHGVDLNKVDHRELIMDIITLSEQWEQSTPLQPALLNRFVQSLASPGESLLKLPWYCNLLGYEVNNVSTCIISDKNVNESISDLSSLTYGDRMMYKRDVFWNKAAVLLENATMLLFSGEWNARYPSVNAKLLANSINAKSNSIESITLMNIGSDVFLNSDISLPTSCGRSIIKSYILNGGDLMQLNRTCLKSFTTSKSFLISENSSLQFFNVSDAFEQSYNCSSINQIQFLHLKAYRTAFYALVVVVIILLGCLLWMIWRSYMRKKILIEEEMLRRYMINHHSHRLPDTLVVADDDSDKSQVLGNLWRLSRTPDYQITEDQASTNSNSIDDNRLSDDKNLVLENLWYRSQLKE